MRRSSGRFRKEGVRNVLNFGHPWTPLDLSVDLPLLSRRARSADRGDPLAQGGRRGPEFFRVGTLLIRPIAERLSQKPGLFEGSGVPC